MNVTNTQKQKDITNYLKQLDLSASEIHLYITLLETGPITVRELAKKTGMKRTTAYSYIDALAEKGLITKLIRNSEGLLCANEPSESLQKLVDNKLKIAIKIKASFSDILKTINASLPQKNISGVADISYYRGKNSVENKYRLDLLYAKEIRGITNISEFLDLFPDTFQIVDKAVQKDKNKKYFELVDDTPLTKRALKESVENTNLRYQCKYFPEGMDIRSTIVTIYDGKVSIINTRNNMSGAIMRSETLYNNFKLLFDLLWNNIPQQ